MKVPKKIKPKKPKLTAEQKAAARAAAKKKREETKFRTAAKEIFSKSGFQYIKSESNEFIFATDQGDRTTELDGIFVYENVLVVMEDTCTTSPGDHLAKKLIIFELALNNKNDFVECLKENITGFKTYFDSNDYVSEDYELRVVYFSMHSISSEHKDNARNKGVQTVERSLTNYFHALVKNISASAKYEILNFLKVSYSDIGKAKISGGSSGSSNTYNGFLLPESNSSYPTGFKVVSFYVDPASLLKKSFVLRKNGWLEPNLSYQRILDMPKIKLMRKYLSENKRVYLGNIIATLPPSTKIKDIENSDQLAAKEQLTIKPVKIELPDEYNVVGLIDGQHRVYSYHEGVDTFDADINPLRVRQNLLVTGIKYPEGVTDQEKILFEAKLFLEINSQQTKVKSVLTQEIELLVTPYSPNAVAKAILMKLAHSGALKDKLEEHVFDDATKLKVSSIVSFGLKPLTKQGGVDSLFDVWTESNKKQDILDKKNLESLGSYVDFCTTEINYFLNAVRISFPGGWHIDHENKLLTPTSINGFLKCLRLIIENKDERGLDFYKSKLINIKEFDFNLYKSSHWNQLGIDLYNAYFSPSI